MTDAVCHAWRPMTVHVVVDTTELVRVPLLDAAGWKELLSRCRRGHVQVLVPEVVVREASRQYGNRVRGDLAQAQKPVSKLRDLGFENTPDLQSTASQADALAASYRSQIEGRLQNVGALVLPIPGVSHSDILDRDSEVRKPFRQSGKGYRDALIWETILEYSERCDEDSTIYFVTDNTSDFCAPGDASLALGLKNEFAVRRLPVSIVRVSSVNKLIKSTLRSHFDQRDGHDEEMEEAVAEPTLPDVIADAIGGASERLIGEAVADMNDAERRRIGALLFDDVTPPEATEVTVTMVESDLDSVDFSIYDQYDGSTIALHASIEATLESEAYVDKALADDYEVVDDDPEERVVFVDFARHVRLWFDLIVVGSDVESVAFDYAEAA
jgi:UDP-N-acetylglucosamine transferase subunit ALG13